MASWSAAPVRPLARAAPIQSAIDRLKEVIKGDDVTAINDAIAAAEQAAQAMAQHMQAQGGHDGTGDSAPPPPNPKGGDDVIDADYEVKN